METKNILFKDIDNGSADIKTGTSLLNRSAIKERIKNTTLESPLTFYTIEKWNAEDEGILITWKTEETLFGEIIIASTAKGVCYMCFTGNNVEAAMKDFKDRFPSNRFLEKSDDWQKEAIRKINDPQGNSPVHLHLKGSDFQMGIWQRLACIPFGGLTTYLELGGSPENARATGKAVGRILLAFF